jgi:hypothetical protein
VPSVSISTGSQRGLGLQPVSAATVDVSGNDLLILGGDLDRPRAHPTIGNARSSPGSSTDWRSKPVIMVRSGGQLAHPLGHAVARTDLSHVRSTVLGTAADRRRQRRPDDRRRAGGRQAPLPLATRHRHRNSDALAVLVPNARPARPVAHGAPVTFARQVSANAYRER